MRIKHLTDGLGGDPPRNVLDENDDIGTADLAGAGKSGEGIEEGALIFEARFHLFDDVSLRQR